MKDSQHHFMPECFGDTLLVSTLINANTNHKRGISEVFVALKSKEFSKQRAIGIIDDDDKKDIYYKAFKRKEETDCFIYLAHPNQLHFLLVLKRDIEDFLIKCGIQANVEHKLLKGGLGKAMKSVNVDKNNDVKDLLNTLLQKKAAPLLQIKKILEQQI